MTRSSLSPRRPDRRPGAVGAVAVLAALALAGCGSTPGAATTSSPSSASSSSSPTSTGSPASDGSPTSTGSSTSPASPTGSGAPKELSVTVTGKQVDPPPGVVRIAVGQVLRLTVTSDHDDELHAHGFDKEAELVAGKPATLDLVTDQPGTYEVETHHPSLRLLKVQVR